MLQSSNEDLELRSIRRGGLQRMAALGVELETIRWFSNHTSVEMLLRYLDWGAVAATRKAAILSAVQGTLASIVNCTARP
jgi:hypothetical protein